MNWLTQGPWWRRIAFGLLLAVSLFWAFSKVCWESTFLDLPDMAANLYARENCVCLFVVGQTEEACREITSQFVPMSSIDVDRGNKTVTVRVFWSIARAKLQANERLGCLIDFP